MRQNIAFSIILMMSVVCIAQNDTGEAPMKISSKVPTAMMISEIPSLRLDHPRVHRNLNQSIRMREIDYTWDWLKKAVNSDMLSGANKEAFQLLSDLGNKKDDALMITWQKDHFYFTVVDGRFLILSVRMTNEALADVETVFRKIVNYSYHANKESVKVHVETLSSHDSKESWGRITVDRGNARGWFEGPVEWHMIGDTIIFAFDKIVKPPVSKIAPEDVSILVGGIPRDDDRSYLRFEKSNREELAKEYFQKRQHDIVIQKDVDKETKGRPLYP